VRGNAPVTPFYAVRLGKFFGTGPEAWINLQRSCDLQNEWRASMAALDAIKPITEAA
jgi:plasmid maintenance system antidote protein VapI